MQVEEWIFLDPVLRTYEVVLVELLDELEPVVELLDELLDEPLVELFVELLDDDANWFFPVA